MSFQVNDRVIVDGEVCTVKYVGPIPAWKHDVAVGVQWDNVDKGKNDGSLNGVRYFDTFESMKIGSFLKCQRMKNVVVAREFFDCLKAKYADTTAGFDILFGAKQVESLGFGRLMKLNSDFKQLTVISLDKEGVADVLSLEPVELPNLRTLDLSFNLFRSLTEVGRICGYCPNVTYLNLSHNVFSSLKIETLKVESVRNLSLNSNFLTKATLKHALTIFENVEVLDLSSNYLTDDWWDPSLMELVSKSKITTLDLSYNKLKRVPWGLSLLEKLTNLNLSYNQVSLDLPTRTWQTLRLLNLGFNALGSYQDLDSVNLQFPKLKHLILHENDFRQLHMELVVEQYYSIKPSITLQQYLDNEVFYRTIYRFNDSLETLDRSAIRVNEKNDAELLFVARRQDPAFQFSANGRARYEYLCDKYRLAEVHEEKACLNSIKLRMIDLTLRLFELSRTVKYLFYQNDSVLRLKGVVKKHFKLQSVLDIKLYFTLQFKDYKDITEEIINNEYQLNHYNFQNGDTIDIKITKN